MSNQPKNKLQLRVQAEYLHGQALRHQLAQKSPDVLEKKYGMSRKTMRKVNKGYHPDATNSQRTASELEQIVKEYRAYLSLREKWLNYTTDEIARRYGITKSTVFRYGRGDFGSRISPNLSDSVDPELLVSDSVERFLTMPTVVRNPVQCFYY